LPEVRCALEVVGFGVALHSGRARVDRIFASHGVKGDTGPLTFVIGAGLRCGGNIAEDLKIANE
jgi:hypothetical protein